jgi:hypothetical protein
LLILCEGNFHFMREPTDGVSCNWNHPLAATTAYASNSGHAGSVNHARAYLWLASSYSMLDPLTGFEMMSDAVKLANGVAELDDYQTAPRLLSLGGASPQVIYIGDSKGDFRVGFRPLARADFPRTLSIAESFNNELLRGVAVITAATVVLQQ